MEPAAYRKRSFFYDRIVLHEIDHAHSGKYQGCAADDRDNKESESFIADTRDDRSYGYAEEIRRALNIMDDPVAVVLITELTCIDPVVS